MNNHDDEKLLLFLKDNEPTPPPASVHAEDGLMALIAQETPQTSRRKSTLAWLVPTAIAAGMAIMWSNNRLSFSPQIAEPDQAETIFVANQSPTDEELEVYLEDTWLGAMESSDYGADDTYGYVELISAP